MRAAVEAQQSGLQHAVINFGNISGALSTIATTPLGGPRDATAGIPPLSRIELSELTLRKLND